MELLNMIRSIEDYQGLMDMVKDTQIQVKESSNDNRVLLSTHFTHNTSHLLDIERECRSVVIDRSTLDVIAYGQPALLYNDQIAIAESEINRHKRIITECIEGTLLVMYQYNGEWLVSTRRCLDASESYWRSKRSHLEMMKDCVDWASFCDLHDPTKVYLYVLVHHENKQLIDYSDRFGKNYTKLMLVLTRDRTTQRAVYRHDIDGTVRPLSQFYLRDVEIGNIIVPQYYDTYSILDDFNKGEESIDHVSKIKNVGILVTLFDSDNKETLVALQTAAYKLYVETTGLLHPPGSQELYIALYQRNQMDYYFNRFSAETYHTTPDGASYQIKGLVDCMFKVLTSELLYLFKVLWDIRSGSQRDENKEIYYSLGQEYKRVFYHLRGIYYSRRLKENTNEKYITIKTVYDLLKGYDAKGLIRLVEDRRRLLQSDSAFTRKLKQYHRNEFMEKPIKFYVYSETFMLSGKTS